MTIDEAIEDAREFIKNCEDEDIAFRVMQVKEWLRQARGAGKAAEYYTAKIRKLEDENAKLREAVKCLYGFARTCGVDEGDMRELGIEVDE